MSTEKLSELSKPVDICNWKMDSWRAAPCNGTEWAKGYFEGWNKYHQKVEGLAPLYSQEYVSALLADNEAKDKRIAEAEVRGVEKLAAAFKSWASDETFPDCEAQRHWATASREALSFAGDLRNGSCDDR